MRQITTREKAFLSIGVLAAVAIFVWFILLPMLQGGEADPKSTLEAKQERLGAVQKLTSISPMLIDLETNVREQSGYKEMSFKRGSASPAMIRYIAQAANKAGIKELDQLDAKLNTSRRSKTEAMNQKEVLKSIVDQLYMTHVLDEVKRAAEENNAEDDPPPDSDTSEESSDTPEKPDNKEASESDNPETVPVEESTNPNASEESSDTPEKSENEEANESDDSEPVQVEESTDPDASEKPETSEAPEDVEQAEPKRAPLFPLIPRDIPHKVKELMAESIKERQGKTLGLANIKEMLDNAEIEDESEVKRVQNRLQGHSKSVKQKKDEMVEWLGHVGSSQTDIASERLKKYTIKMVFKSKMGQLVRFLYNLQDSAKWLRVDSMRIGISDRKETTLSVQLSMTATVLYGLAE